MKNLHDTKILKLNIYENKKIPLILDAMGCVGITETGNYYRCTNVCSESLSRNQPNNAISISNDSTLKVWNFADSIEWEKRFGKNPDIFSLIEYNKDYIFNDGIFTFNKAVNWLIDIISSDNKDNDKPKPTQKQSYNTVEHSQSLTDIQHEISKACENWPEQRLKRYKPILHDDWKREGINEHTRKKFNICFSNELQRIVIPWRYQDGRLLGINGRIVNKYMNNPNIYYSERKYYCKGLPASYCLYGLYENKEDILKRGCVVVVEGEKSVCKADSLELPFFVATKGHSISDEQIRLLSELGVEVCIAFDKDVKETEIISICDRFPSDVFVTYILDDMGLLKDKDSPIDEGINVFKKLFAYRRKTPSKLLKN